MKKLSLSALGFLLIALSSGQDCGVRNPDGIGFRIKGSSDVETNYGEFPWMVAVLKIEPVDDSSEILRVYRCGGSLIHPQAIITSVKCVKNQKEKYIIRGGEWDTLTANELYHHQDRSVKTVIIHPEYNAETANNDIALLIVEKPFNTTDAENVKTVCLPPQDKISENTECFVTSWGANKGKYHTILEKYNLQVIEKNNCEEQLRKTHLGNQYTLHEGFICSNSSNCGAGKGDPFVCSIPGKPDRYYQAGIGSWDLGCDSNSTPVVYTNVGKFRQWIDTEIEKLNLDTTFYTY